MKALFRALLIAGLSITAYVAWDRGLLDEYLPDQFKKATTPATDPTPATPATVAAAPSSSYGKEGQHLADNWLYVSGWSRDNIVFTVAMMQIESAGRVGAVSEKDAYGLMQVILPTAEDMHDNYGYNLLDATQANLLTAEGSIYFGTAYLEHLASIQNGRNMEWMIRAYNGGPSRAARYAAGTGPKGGQAHNDGHYAAFMKAYNSLITTA